MSGNAASASFVPRGRHLFIYDLVAIGLAILGAFALRFDANDVLGALRPYLPVVLLPLVTQPLVNVAFGLYRREWRYASMRELIGVVAAIGTGSAITGGLVLILSSFEFPGTAGLPRSYLPLEGMLSLLLIGGGRFSLRWALENSGRSGETDEERSGVRTLVYGAGEAGAAVARLAERDPAMNLKIVGFLDDDPHKRGSRLLGIRIFGGLERLAEATRTTRARQLVVAMPSSSGAIVRRAVDSGQGLGHDVKIIPPLHEVLSATDHGPRIRSVSVEDLLRREPVRVDLTELADYLNGASVVVTGAGGSIGGELARQIFTLGPRRLVLVDNNEAALWGIERELRERQGIEGPHLVGRLCDVRSPIATARIVHEAEPDVVFHAAALKHVPICELQPCEAVLTNVVGTLNLLRACEDAGVARFILISTDKAVEPVSVMGATKRLAEILTLASGRRSGRTRIAVRFGNVLGSSGSVVPIFSHQLEHGIPLTVTHPDATRYFMTIPEAVSLILQAGADEASGDVYILDMGEPVRIVDLAEDMIRLSGVARANVEIVYTGLRPGERLTEQLVYDEETMDRTAHDRVWKVKATAAPGLTQPIPSVLADLERAAVQGNDRLVREQLTAIGVLHPGTDRTWTEVSA